MNPENTKLVLRDYPILGWVFGVALLIMAASNLVIGTFTSGAPALVVRGILALAGLGILLLASALTVTADRVGQLLTLRRRSFLKGSTQEILFSQIDAIQLETSYSQESSRSNSSPTYRIVIVLKDGGVVPFRSYYTSGAGDKTRKIKQLREFIGVGGSDMGMGLMGTLREATKKAQQEMQQQQEALTGSLEDVHQTDGVSWQVQTVVFGGSPVTRWFSPDYQIPDGFVYVTQLIEGQKMAGGGLLASLSGMLFRQTMAMYGFGQEDTPEPEPANMLRLPDPCLAAFSVYTSAPTTAQKLLNPWVVAALADWVRRYPLKKIQSEEIFSQLVVMFSPKGVYVASLGTMIPEAVEDMARLGVELIKTQPDAQKKDAAAGA